MVCGAHGRRAARVTQPLPPVWDAERDEALVCVGVRQETHDVSTFVFAPVEPRLFRFLPGQFMTFDLPVAADRPAVGDLPRAGDLPAVGQGPGLHLVNHLSK